MDPPRPRDDPEPGIGDVVDRILSTLLWVAATLGALALAGSLFRWAEQGWHPRQAVHIVVYTVILAALVAGRRLSRLVRAGVIVGFIGFNGISNLYWDGLPSNGMLALSVACILAGVFLRTRVAAVAVVASLIAIALVAVGFARGSLPTPANLEVVLRSPANWFAYATTFAVFTGAVLASIDGVQRALSRSLEQLEQRSAALREREKYYRLLAENVRDVVFQQDMELKLTYVSPSATQLFGYGPEELMQLTIADVLVPESLERAFRAFREYSQRAEHQDVDVPLMDYEYVRKDGSRFWGELRVSFLRDGDGRLCGSQGILRDITVRKRAQQEQGRLQERLAHTEQQNALGQLAGGIAHDFNNQLGGIIGFADLLSLTKDPERIREYAAHILTSARRAADLTGQLLAFARRGHARKEPVDVHRIIGEVRSVLERSIDRTIHIRCDLRASRATVSGDATLLQNALLNVALNARDSMPEGGQLTFGTSEEPPSTSETSAASPRRLIVRVTDTGVGMDAETRRHIFEPFFTTKDPGRGTGMGLAAVYGTITSHGGTIEVESAPGQGTRFILYLPLIDANAPVSDPAQPVVAKGNGHILVVEDEPAVRRATQAVLETVGYRVTSCATGNEAIRAFESAWQNVDLVLLDMVLPDLPGRQVFDALRRVDCRARVLLVSGYSAEGDVERLLEKGAAGFLQKPHGAGELSEHVARLLAQRAVPVAGSDRGEPAPRKLAVDP